MTQQEKRIKLAEAEGWTSVRIVSGEPMGRPPKTTDRFEVAPDYFNDLNAVHGLAASLSRQPDALRGYSDYTRYCVQLERLCGELPYDATAEQRAEAIGITLGLWENGE